MSPRPDGEPVKVADGEGGRCLAPGCDATIREGEALCTEHRAVVAKRLARALGER